MMDRIQESLINLLMGELESLAVDGVREGLNLLKRHMKGQASDAEIMAYMKARLRSDDAQV